jgi:hypothetical protein
MTTKQITSSLPQERITTITSSLNPVVPWLVLVSRSLLFLLFQVVITGLLYLSGKVSAWDESARWWLFTVIPANLVSIFLLVRLFHSEGKRYIDILRFSKMTWRKDLAWLIGSSVVGLPIMALPMTNLAVLIFGDSMVPINMMFRSLPAWALGVGFLFPLTIAFAELPTYFGYVMPRLAGLVKNGWVAWLIASFFLGFQHCFLPLILDGRFILWRLGMYLPFALFAGLLLKLRPSLLPYFAVIHALIDFSTLSVYWMI